MATPEQRLDCVLLGFHDVDFQSMVDEARSSSGRSGYYDYLLHNSVLVDHRRYTYMQYLNRVIGQATGRDPQHHVAALPNLASCYLHSFLRGRGLDVEIVNLLEHEEERFRDLLAARPRAVAVSTTLYLDPRPLQEIVAFIRRCNSETRIVVGGPYLWNVCKGNDQSTQDFVLQSIGADLYVDDSQGEATLAAVLHALREPAPDLSAIPNLVIATAAGFERTRKEPEDNDLDACGIDWSGFDPSYITPTVQTRTARSCAFKCAFCSHPALAGPLSLASLETIERELEGMAAAGVKNVVFIDDTFNVPLPRFKKLCQMIADRDFGFRWYSYFRCSNADDRAFDLMAESGCAGVFLGIESGDQTILQNMGKSAKVPRLKDGVKKLNERDIVTFASFIIGFPGETDETVRNTVAFIEETEPRFYRAELWYADPHTPIAERTEEFDIRGGAFSWSHRTMDWRRASEWVREIYGSVRSSTILPVYGFDFWSIPYLVGQGFDVDQIERFAAGAGELMLAGLDDLPFDHRAAEARLVSQFSGPA